MSEAETKSSVQIQACVDLDKLRRCYAPWLDHLTEDDFCLAMDALFMSMDPGATAVIQIPDTTSTLVPYTLLANTIHHHTAQGSVTVHDALSPRGGDWLFHHCDSPWEYFQQLGNFRLSPWNHCAYEHRKTFFRHLLHTPVGHSTVVRTADNGEDLHIAYIDDCDVGPMLYRKPTHS